MIHPQYIQRRTDPGIAVAEHNLNPPSLLSLFHCNCIKVAQHGIALHWTAYVSSDPKKPVSLRHMSMQSDTYIQRFKTVRGVISAPMEMDRNVVNADKSIARAWSYCKGNVVFSVLCGAMTWRWHCDSMTGTCGTHVACPYGVAVVGVIGGIWFVVKRIECRVLKEWQGGGM